MGLRLTLVGWFDPDARTPKSELQAPQPGCRMYEGKEEEPLWREHYTTWCWYRSLEARPGSPGNLPA